MAVGRSVEPRLCAHDPDGGGKRCRGGLSLWNSRGRATAATPSIASQARLGLRPQAPPAAPIPMGAGDRANMGVQTSGRIWTRPGALSFPEMRLAFGTTVGYVNRPCSGALPPLLLAIPMALSSPVCRPSAPRRRPGRRGCMKLSTTASASSAVAKAIGFACFLDAATIGPTGCHGLWTPSLGFPHLR